MTCPITSAAALPVRSLAVFPWFAQVVHCFVPLGQGRWDAGWGVDGGLLALVW
ncbi:MAG: hypothetical protein GY832_05070 [Chloroflexi bacterium]|nr:hypothetical protein [Chloroflexota bacterium]